MKLQLLSFTLLVLFVSSSPASAQCQHKLLAGSATAQDAFGNSVAQTPRYAVIGAYFEAGAGAAYVYEPTGDGWVQTGRLVAGAPTGGDFFGNTVAVSGPTVVVSAPFSDAAPLELTGSAHVFVKDGGAWLESQVLRASDREDRDQFGFGLAIDGGLIAVGAPNHDVNSLADAGAVYLFEDQAGTWIEIDKLTASDAVAGDGFGYAVAVSGDTLLIGAPFSDLGGSKSGSAYVFRYDGSAWNETQKLSSASPDASDEFARQVAMSGDIAIIGARNDDDSGRDAGAAYVYEKGGSTWAFTQKLTSIVGAPNERFGASVAAGSDMLAAGAPFRDSLGTDRGGAHVFTSFGGGWVESLTVEASDGMNFDRFGTSVALGGGQVLVGAVQNDEAASNAGAAYAIPIEGPDCDMNGILDACEPSLFLEFCFGDGGPTPGCTNCPCGNNAPSGSCGGCLNGTGSGARILPSGVPDLLGSSFRVDMENGNPNNFAILISGSVRLPRNATNPCFGVFSGIDSILLDGLRCTGGSVKRHRTLPTDSNGDVGLTNAPWGAVAAFLGDVGFLAGDTRYFQSFYRESIALGCGTGLNTSQAFAVTILP